MKLPGYCYRSPIELRRALRWAVKAAHLDGWDVELLLDDRFRKFPPLKGMKGDAAVHYNLGRQHARIGLDTRTCEKFDDDPLVILFHEVAHLVHSPAQAADPKQIHSDLWEQSANRVALLLLALYDKEH